MIALLEYRGLCRAVLYCTTLSFWHTSYFVRSTVLPARRGVYHFHAAVECDIIELFLRGRLARKTHWAFVRIIWIMVRHCSSACALRMRILLIPYPPPVFERAPCGYEYYCTCCSACERGILAVPPVWPQKCLLHENEPVS